MPKLKRKHPQRWQPVRTVKAPRAPPPSPKRQETASRTERPAVDPYRALIEELVAERGGDWPANTTAYFPASGAELMELERVHAIGPRFVVDDAAESLEDAIDVRLSISPHTPRRLAIFRSPYHDERCTFCVY